MKALLIVFILLSGCDLFTPKSDIDKIIEKEQNKLLEEYHKGNVSIEKLMYTMILIKYNLAIKSNPEDKDAYLLRAYHKASFGDYKGAILDYDKLIVSDGSNFLYYEGRGNAKSEMEDYEGAILDYNKALENYPSRRSYLQRGKARYKLGDIKNACLDWNKVKPLEWDYTMESDYSDAPDYTYDEASELKEIFCR
jgi:tetratricopeptide (TPR) repeat protein